MNAKITDLIGKTMTNVERKKIETTRYGENEGIFFTTTDGDVFCLKHFQDCCEEVYIESIVGDLSDLVGVPILIAEEVSNILREDEENCEQEEWTFYKFATIRGYVDVRWHGTSNGYYSTSVNFCKELKK